MDSNYNPNDPNNRRGGPNGPNGPSGPDGYNNNYYQNFNGPNNGVPVSQPYVNDHFQPPIDPRLKETGEDVVEKELKAGSGFLRLILILVTWLGALFLVIFSAAKMSGYGEVSRVWPVLMVLSIIHMATGWFWLLGLRVIKPQEALVLTVFGRYTGTLKKEGFYYVSPFSVSVNPAAGTTLGQSGDVDTKNKTITINDVKTNEVAVMKKKISLKVMTLNNSKQKVNDALGNPVEVGVAVMWRVADTAKAVFNVDNFKEYLSLQSDAAVRNICRVYPYDIAPGIDTTGDGEPDEGSLRGSSNIVAQRIKEEIQERVDFAGIEVLEARITYLAYATEIAAAMLQRQQASAVVDARATIVDGAVGMVDLALQKLSQEGIVELDEERKAAMVSNLMVVLCSKSDVQPVVNSSGLY